jgi:signal transduction histidine kinase
MAARVDRDAYDWMFQLHPPVITNVSSVVLAIDERTLTSLGGMRNLRHTLADGLSIVNTGDPAAVAIDLTLSDSADPAEDAALEKALCHTKNLVLASDIILRTDRWEQPIPQFAHCAAAIGHVHASPDPVSRVLPLELRSAGVRRWALALEALRLAKGGSVVTESPDDLDVAGIRIPVSWKNERVLPIRYLPPPPSGESQIPQISFAALHDDPSLSRQFAGKVVFIGVTAQSAARDRLATPYGLEMMSGVEIHANAYETMARQDFLTYASRTSVVGFCLLLTVLSGVVFAIWTGWQAYTVGAVLMISAHIVPHVAFTQGVIFPYLGPVLAGWLSVAAAAAWQHFVVRRQLRKSESDRARYQQAIHFVTHEMRSPLTAIQGSSEMMGRYNLNEEKRKQMAGMINTESKRLARMIQTFLDIERLTDGQMELNSEVFNARSILDVCIQRAQPLAERKQIQLREENREENVDDFSLTGDRELMEYAFYNLLTNAIKYSPSNTVVTVRTLRDGSSVRLSVNDQGIGMDARELKNIFKKFYRTKKAEASGEIGTGIGLSIVDQIVSHHGGRMEVASTPGVGSSFTIVLPQTSQRRELS